MNRYSTIVFDVGGTLLHFDYQALAQVYVAAGRDWGMPVGLDQACGVLEALELEMPVRQQQRLISLEEDNGKRFWEEFFSEGFRRLGVTREVAPAAAAIRERFQRGEFETAFDDVKPTLDTLTARGLTLGILSNFSSNCDDVLRQIGVHQHFSFFVVSALAGVEKPDPRIFDLTVRAANRPREEIVYVGDSIYHDMEGALRAGMDAILVDRQNQHADWKGARVQNMQELIRYLG